MKLLKYTFQNTIRFSGRIVLMGCLALTALPSCSNFLDIGNPPDKITEDKIFKSDNTATAAMLSTYIDMMNDQFGSNGSFVCAAMSSQAGLSANELSYMGTGLTQPPFKQFNDHNLTPDNTYVQAFWRDGYKYIYRMNAIVSGLSTATGMSDAVKKQLEGEAKFMRAFCYFYLVNLFGDVPLVLNTSYQDNMLIPRTPSDKVWAQIISDLKDAKNLLTDTYVTAEHLRPNKWTATALLARAYLYTEKWQDAENESNAVISSGVYSLQTVDKVFKKDSPETIWQLQPVRANTNTLEATLFLVTGVTQPTYQLTQNLLGSFELNDKRKTNWVGFSNPNDLTWAYPAKYKATGATVTEYYVVFRLAEQYFIRAEARAQLSKITEGQSDVNLVRQRAGISNISVSTKEALLQAIEQERKVEFFAEWGHRWLDLKRTKRTEAVLKPLSQSQTWKQGTELYPVPAHELSANPKLVQNNAYL
ncbi:RagB/SusD family nutrient uptake outer membrane protein [Solitalea koreensis]|uniref:RagB/SusD domain-containing protein n=1 Tax=Solitalea koreensis TaxID=543615 RepID=A0A521CEE9_9SPHI|nr:RagB/SusD family nutrient uptake outer membrane protein [Solitalea koreensis]SMO57798.1 RagB/SusD domain-containing protein [Solitalea koreensis]